MRDCELRHGKVGDVGSRKTRPDPDRSGGNQTVCLVQRDTMLGELAPPGPRTDTLGYAERCQAESVEQSADSGLLVGPDSPPDLFNRDRADPRLRTGSPESHETRPCGSSAQRIDEHRRVEKKTSHESSAGAAGIPVTLSADPCRGVLVPRVAAVGKLPECCFDIVPPPLVVQAAPDQFGDEGAAPARTCSLIELGYEVVVQGYVQSHVPNLAHTETLRDGLRSSAGSPAPGAAPKRRSMPRGINGQAATG